MKWPKFPTIWAERVQKLIWATGEKPDEICKRWGCGGSAIERIIDGGRPRANFVLRLRSLEAQFYRDLIDLEAGRIRLERGGLHQSDGRRTKNWRRWKRIDERDSGSHSRPSELKAMGAVGMAGSALSRPPQKALHVSADDGPEGGRNLPDGSGRPATRASGSGNVGEGVSRC